MKNIFSLFSFFSLLVILSSCQKDHGSLPIFNGQGNIGTQGGIVKTDNGASIEVPSGALKNNQTISIANITEGDTVINNGCGIYELKPDGLTFSDSAIITLPFDDKYIDLFKQENYGISIMVFQDTGWLKLNTKVDLKNKNAKAKTVHFSKYVINYPSEWTAFFYENKNNPKQSYNVPFYLQDGNWCFFYALNMITKYAGYPYKAAFFASSMGFNSPTSWLWNPGASDLPMIDARLADLDIMTERASPSWGNEYDLCGYLIKKLSLGYPVWIGAQSIHHAFVVTGHDPEGFYINDSGGVLTEICGQKLSEYMGELISLHIPYNNFIEILKGKLDIGSLHTLVIKSEGTESKAGITLNFRSSSFELKVIEIKTDGVNKIITTKGELEINGKYKPNGYRIIDCSTREEGNFEGSYYISINPSVANSNLITGVNAFLDCKIDGKNVEGSPILLNVLPKVAYYHPQKGIQARLGNLQKGLHHVTVELYSEDSQIKYDSWSFELNIANEFIDNGQPPNVPSDPNPENGATGISLSPTLSWSGSDPDGDALTYDVYFGTAENSTVKIVSDVLTPSISRDGLMPGVEYYWKVVAYDDHGNSTSGPEWSFTTSSPNISLTDIEGNVYKTVTIGNQVWMAENLKTTKYSDGTPIHLVTNNAAWQALTTGAYCDYINTPTNSITYGRLYNWYTVDNNATTKFASNDGKNVCPTGWHVPTHSEWTTLITYLGGVSVAGSKLKEAGIIHWPAPNTGATNETGFTALPGGFRALDGTFYTIGTSGYWWSSTEATTSYSWFWGIDSPNTILGNGAYYKQYGYSVRCIKDN